MSHRPTTDLPRTPDAPRALALAALAVVVMASLALLPAPDALAELGGNCELLAPEFGNPGLGCKGEGDACTINGAAGKCTNMKRPIESVIYCVCSPDGEEVPEEVEATAVADSALATGCGSEATFHIDESAPHIVDIAFKTADGGEVVRIESFTGSFGVSTHPTADPDRCRLTIEWGDFTAPSFKLPDGTETGVNVYTFGPDADSAGVLDLSTGKYRASARGHISNALYPDLPTRGTYRGTVDFDAGSITIDTTTLDLVDGDDPPSDVEPVPADTEPTDPVSTTSVP